MIIDCFAGGGGASVGIEMALGRSVDIAINHDPDAILMHKTNHPNTLHLTEDIFRVDLKKYVKGRHVALMWASPDCTSHVELVFNRDMAINEAEQIQNCSNSQGIVSDETLIAHHPFVSDVEEELEALKRQKEAYSPSWDQAPIVKDEGNGEE